VDESWARRFALWASYAFGQPLPAGQPGVGRNAFAHESGIHADGELYDDELRLIAANPHQLALLYPGLLS